MVEFLDMYFLAMIAEQDFHDFQSCISEIRQWPTYEDFAMDRDGSFVGMSWAGLNVVQVEVPLRLFTRWVDLTGSPCTLRNLDDFAMRRWLRARYPDWNPRIIRSKATTPPADQSGHLDIPVCLTAAEALHLQERGGFLQAEGARNDGLADAIARECLDPAE